MATGDIDGNKERLVVRIMGMLFSMKNTGKYILRKHGEECNGDLSGAAARTGISMEKRGKK